MRRDQLEHAIRAACQITGQLEVIVVGSQAILGTYPEYELPSAATRSLEVDILPITDDNNQTIELADLIVGVAGELSQFQQTHGFSIDGVDLTTSALPDGWRSRLVKVKRENTAAPGGQPQYIGWCLDEEDLCVANLCAFREKDHILLHSLMFLTSCQRCTFAMSVLNLIYLSRTSFALQLKLRRSPRVLCCARC